jgi:hypothetical protein
LDEISIFFFFLSDHGVQRNLLLRHFLFLGLFVFSEGLTFPVFGVGQTEKPFLLLVIDKPRDFSAHLKELLPITLVCDRRLIRSG